MFIPVMQIITAGNKAYTHFPRASNPPTRKGARTINTRALARSLEWKKGESSTCSASTQHIGQSKLFSVGDCERIDRFDFYPHTGVFAMVGL